MYSAPFCMGAYSSTGASVLELAHVTVQLQGVHDDAASQGGEGLLAPNCGCSVHSSHCLCTAIQEAC